MIKKLIGIIVAVAVVVIIVVAAIRRDNFQSMVRRDELLNGVEPAAEPPHLISPAELDVPAEGVPAKDAPAAGTVDSKLRIRFRKPGSVCMQRRPRKGPPFFVRRGGAVREKRSRRSPPAGFAPVRSI